MDCVIPRSLFDRAISHWVICAGCCGLSHECASICLFLWLYSGLWSGLASLSDEAFPLVPGRIGFPTKEPSPALKVHPLFEVMIGMRPGVFLR
jgi:hypothetical protein